jgi:hypothetical protein
MGQLTLPISLPNNPPIWINDNEYMSDSNGTVIAFVVHWKDDVGFYVWHPAEKAEEWYQTLIKLGTDATAAISGGITGGILGLMKSRNLGIIGAGVGAAAALSTFLLTVQNNQKKSEANPGYYRYGTHHLFYGKPILVRDLKKVVAK